MSACHIHRISKDVICSVANLKNHCRISQALLLNRHVAVNTLLDILTELFSVSLNSGGLGSVVGIATGYGLDGPGIESRWRREFLHLFRRALGPTQLPIQWVPCLSRAKERPGRDADPSTPSSAVVKKG